MNKLMQLLSNDFLPKFLAGMVVNFEIAAIALVIGVALGLLLAAGRLSGGVVTAVTVSIISLMRAAPTFVVMFFLLNAIPRDATLFGVPFALSGVMTVALSLVPYSAAYVADSGVDSIRHLRAGTTHGAFLFFPNVTRAFFVMVMSSSAGAAIGVTEGITVILRQAEQLQSFNDRLVLFALGIVLFGIPLQAGFMLMSLFQRRFGRSAVEEEASA
jgi:ABC-type arginine/histidine transport system permease subunit